MEDVMMIDVGRPYGGLAMLWKKIIRYKCEIFR